MNNKLVKDVGVNVATFVAMEVAAAVIQAPETKEFCKKRVTSMTEARTNATKELVDRHNKNKLEKINKKIDKYNNMKSIYCN